MLIPLFVLLLLLGQEEDNKRLSWFPNLLLLEAALSRLDVGPAYYEDPVSNNPTYKKDIKTPCIGWSYEAFLIIRERGKGFFSWCAGAHFRFPFINIIGWGSRGSYAAAFPGAFLLVLRPEAIASS